MEIERLSREVARAKRKILKENQAIGADVISMKMNRKLFTIIVVIIVAVVAISGVLTFETLARREPVVTVVWQTSTLRPPTIYHISESSAHYYVNGYTGWATAITIDSNITCSRQVVLNDNNFYLTSNGQPLTNIEQEASGGSQYFPVYGGPGYYLSHQFSFEIAGNVTSDFQLAYNGTANVRIIPSP